MDPLNAQQISRIENSERFKHTSQKEATRFIRPKRKLFQLITTLFNPKEEVLKKNDQQNALPQNLNLEHQRKETL